jgi:phospholipid/cholesterol/gamma-HCH transport system ATP-binding protein
MTTPTPKIQIPKIQIRGLHVAFGSNVVLDHLDLDVGAGESVVIIGGSGSGKSVLLKSILGLIHPQAGSILIDGEETVGMRGKDRDRINRKFGMLFQAAALFDSLPVWRNISFSLIEGRGMGLPEARKLALDRLSAVGLAPNVADMWPAELSGGMKKRVGLARAIAAEPDLVFFDEPTTGLDPIMGAKIDELIVKLVRELGATALSITHDMASARRICNRVAMLYNGRIIWQGPVGEIDSSGNPYVEQFIHGSAEGPIQMESATP